MVADIKINETSMEMLTKGKLDFLFKTYDMDSPELSSKSQVRIERAIRDRGVRGATAPELERRLGFNLARNLHQYLALLIVKGYIFRKVNPKQKNGYRYYSICHLAEEERTVPLKLTIDWRRVAGG